MRWGRLLVFCLLCVAWLPGRSAAPAHAAPATTPERRLPWRIARGPDDAMWFTEQNANRLGRITTAGSVREYPIPTPRSGPQGIAACADGAIWFTEAFADQIGRLDPATGHLREYALPRLGSRPAEIACGADGDLSFADSYEQYAGRLDPRTGQVAEYPVCAARATDVAVTSDGAAWFTYDNTVGSNIARIDEQGHYTWLQARVLPHGTAVGITTATAGAVWFAESDPSRVSRIALTAGRTGVTPTITTYPLPDDPLALAAAPDGAVWVTQRDTIGRVTPTGHVREFPLDPDQDAVPYGIAAGPDGTLWFTDPATDIIGHITPTGAITRFDLADAPGPRSTTPPAAPIALGARYAALNPAPSGIATAPDGTVWFTETYGDRIGRLTLDGAFSFYAIPTARSGPHGIAIAPDGTVWFAEQYGGAVAALDPATGHIREYPVPTPGSYPLNIAIMPDGMIWFTEFYYGAIGRLDPGTGRIREFPLPFGGGPTALVSGPDGNVWFTEHDSGTVGRITPAGRVREYPLPRPSLPNVPLTPTALTLGPDGALWLVESTGGVVYRRTPDGHFTPFITGSERDAGAVTLVAGHDGGIWFTTIGAGVGRLDRHGRRTLYRPGRLPALLLGGFSDYDLRAMAAGANDTVWIAATLENAIVRVTPDGAQTRFGIPGRSGQPIALLAQGTTLWIGQPGADALLRRSPDGQIHRYLVPTPHAEPSSLAAAPDGTIWFTEEAAGKIGRIDAGGHLTEYPLPDAGAEPAAIAVTTATTTPVPAGSSSSVWVAEARTDRIGRLDPITGLVQEYPLPRGADCPDALALAPAGGGLRFGLCASHRIGRISPTGAITLEQGPQDTFYGQLRSAPDGTLWIAGEWAQQDLQSITPGGLLVNHNLPDTYGTPTDVAIGPDGLVWFTEKDQNRVGRLDPRTNQVAEYPLPTALSAPTGIAIDRTGAVWCAEQDGNALVRISRRGGMRQYPLPPAQRS